MVSPTKISANLGVNYDGDTKLYIQDRVFELSDEEMQKLIVWYTQGLCRVCFAEITNSVICNDCLAIYTRDARAAMEEAK